MSAAGQPAPNTTDLTVLRTEAYADSANLDDRRALYDFQDPRPDFFGWILDQVNWPDRGRVLDLGCGPGSHLARLADRRPGVDLVGADVSVGMLRTARTVAPAAALVGLDASALPFADQSFAVVMANHMLYHVADLDQVVGGIRRSLVAGGTLLAVTNSVEHLDELYADLAHAAGRDHWDRPTDHFTLEDHGPALRRCFDHVELRHHLGELVVPHVAPLVAYAESTQALCGQGYTQEEWDELMVNAEARFRSRIETEGAYRIRAHVGAFVCR